MLGYGAAAVIVSLYHKLFMRHFYVAIRLLLFTCSLLMILAPWLMSFPFLQFDSILLFASKWHWLKLLGNYIFFMLPFFLGALVITMIYTKHVKQVGKYYFADLFGAGIGAIGVLLLFSLLKPQRVFAAIAIIPLISGFLISSDAYRKALQGMGILCLIIIVFAFAKPFEFNLSQFKAVTKSINLPKTKIIKEQNSVYGFMQIVSSPAMRYGHGISLNYRGEIPKCNQLFINGDWYGSILNNTQNDTSHILNHTPLGLAYFLKNKQNVLILQCGTANQVYQAFINNSNKITGLEPNKMVVKEISQRIDNLPGINVYCIDSRAYLSRTNEVYDLIIFPTMGVFGGEVGAGAMTEQNLFTKEAIKQSFEHLSPQGMLHMECFTDYPVKTPYKIASLIANLFQTVAINKPEQNLVILKSWNTLSFYIFKKPINASTHQKIEEFSTLHSFELISIEHPNDNELSNFLNQIFIKGNSFIDSYPFNIKAPTDDRPYFSQFLRWKSFASLKQYYGGFSLPYMELGYLIVLITFIQVLVLSILLVLLPLRKIKWQGKKNFWVLFYFTGIGIGFMFFEIVMIKHFVRYLGYPVYAASMAIGVLLVSSGIGSYFSGKTNMQKVSLKFLTLMVIILLIVIAYSLNLLLNKTLHLNPTGQILISVLLLAMPGVFMGMLFPRALQLISKQESSQIPWAYGINSVASVVGACLAAILCVEIGFKLVIVLAACSYIISLLALIINRLN